MTSLTAVGHHLETLWPPLLGPALVSILFLGLAGRQFEVHQKLRNKGDRDFPVWPSHSSCRKSRGLDVRPWCWTEQPRGPWNQPAFQPLEPRPCPAPHGCLWGMAQAPCFPGIPWGAGQRAPATQLFCLNRSPCV